MNGIKITSVWLISAQNGHNNVKKIKENPRLIVFKLKVTCYILNWFFHRTHFAKYNEEIQYFA